MADQNSKEFKLVSKKPNAELSIPAELAKRGLELALSIEKSQGIEKRNQPILKFPGLLKRSCVTFSKNGVLAALSSHGKQKDNPGLVIWNMDNLMLSIYPEAGVQDFTPAQHFIEHALEDDFPISDVKISTNFNRSKTKSSPESSPGNINCVALSDTGTIALIGYSNGSIGTCEVHDGVISEKRIIRKDPKTQGIGCLAISPDNYLFAGSFGPGVHLWEAKSGREIYRLDGHNRFFNQLSFSDDGSKLLIAKTDVKNRPHLTLLDFKGRRPPLFFRNERTEKISAVAISSKNDLLATMNKGIISLWDAKSGYEIRYWNHTTSEVNDVIKGYSWTERAEIPYSDEYDIVISKNTDPPLILRNPYTWGLSSIAISPDGNQILSGGGDKFMRLWTIDGDVIREYPHESQVVKVAFHPEGHRIFAGCINGAIYVWELS